MQDEQSASTLPGGGNLRALNEASSEEAPTFVPSMQREIDGPQGLRRILLVEDDLSLANLEADILTAHGYAVATADSGERAVAALRQSTPDLVVLDLQLDGQISGWEVLQDLRTRATIPVLLTSSDNAVRSHMRTSGETRATLDHLPKPYPMHAFVRRIERMFMIVPR